MRRSAEAGERQTGRKLKALALEFASAEAAEDLRKAAEEGVYLMLGREYRQAALRPTGRPHAASKLGRDTPH